MSTNNPSLVVQRLDRASDISSSSGLPYKCLVFPVTGGVQAIDAVGTVLNLVGATGALAATVTDAVNNAASTALSLVHALSAGVGANGIGVTQRFVLPNSLGVAASAGQLTVSYTDATSGSEDSALGITLQVGGAGTPVLAISAPTAGATTLTAAGSASASLNLVGAGGITLRNSGNTATIFGVQSVASGNYAPTMWASNESGTPGAAVIHRPSGQVAVAIGASSVTVTNDLVTATSVVIATLQFVDATFTQILSVVPGAGSFVITGNAVAAAPTKIGFIVINPSA